MQLRARSRTREGPADLQPDAADRAGALLVHALGAARDGSMVSCLATRAGDHARREAGRYGRGGDEAGRPVRALVGWAAPGAGGPGRDNASRAGQAAQRSHSKPIQVSQVLGAGRGSEKGCHGKVGQVTKKRPRRAAVAVRLPGFEATTWEERICDCPKKGRLVLTQETFTTGPDTSWREHPIVLGSFRCARCGQVWLFTRKPNEEERPRCHPPAWQSGTSP